MTQDEIIEMVREADLDWHTGWTLDEEQSNRFEVLVKLVDAKATAREQKKWEDQTAVEIHEAVLEEREACAKVADELVGQDLEHNFSTLIAHNIRARGYKQDGQCKRCKDGCPACDATKLPKEAHDLL